MAISVNNLNFNRVERVTLFNGAVRIANPPITIPGSSLAVRENAIKELVAAREKPEKKYAEFLKRWGSPAEE